MKRIVAIAAWLGLALALSAAPASAQNCSGQPAANTVCAGPTSGGGGLPNFRALVGGDIAPLSPTLTGNWIFSPASGVAITVNPASNAAAFVVNNATVTAVNSPTISITRTENILSGVGGGDGSNGPAILVNISSLNTSVMQANGITSRVTTAGTNDAVAFYGVGTSSGAGTNTGFGGFFAGVANSATAGGIALALQTNNQRGNDLAFNGASIAAPVLFGLDVAYTSQTSGGTPTSNYGGAAVLVRAINGKWDVGIGFAQGDMVRTAEIQSGTNSSYILQAIAGSHAHGICLSCGATYTTDMLVAGGLTIDTLGGITDSESINVNGATNKGFTVTDSTVTGQLTTSAAHTHSLVVGTSSNHALVFISNNAEVGSVTETATTAPWVLGVLNTRIGTLAFNGNTSGTATITPQAAAGTPTLTLPNANGTFAVSASAPLALSATTGNLTVTGATGQILAGSGPAFTATPTLTPSQASNTSADSLILSDTTAAPSSGNQQYSPRLRFTGQGWKTNATAGSQTVDWIIENQPVQGAANPNMLLNFASQTNGAGYNSRLQIVDQIPDGNGLTVNFLGVASTQFALKLSGTTSGVFYVDTSQMLMGAQSNVPASIIVNGAAVLTGLTAGNMKFANAASFSANGSVATVLGSIGPVGSHTTVQKWLTIVDSTGATLYIPAF